jgi:predicted ATPase with chaperone activity
MSQLNLSARGITVCSGWRAPYVDRIGQAIADLAGRDEIQSVHLAEALQYRPKLMLS